MPSATLHLAGRDVRLPADHPLAEIVRQWPQYGGNVGRIAAALAGAVPGLAVIDVGGNVGDTVVVIRERTDAPVLTIEGYQPYLAYLRENVAGLAGVAVEESFIAGIRAAAGPVGVWASGGTAHLSDAAGSDAGAVTSLRSLDDVLARHPGFAGAKLFKLDTDGMDVSIVLASLRYVERVRPVIFLEYDPTMADAAQVPADRLWDPVRRLGYRFALVWENTGYYVGCMDLTDDLVPAELHAAATGWQSKRYWDLCLVHSSDAALAGAIRRGEVEFAGVAPRFGVRTGPPKPS